MFEYSYLSMGTIGLPKNLSNRYVLEQNVLNAFFSASLSLLVLKSMIVHSNKKSGKPLSSGKFL